MKNQIADIDPNLAADAACAEKGVCWFSPQEAPFGIYGLYRPLESLPYRRMPESVAQAVSLGVYRLHTCTAGGRIRFRTNSPYVALVAQMNVPCHMPHMPLAGSAGFDLYETNEKETYLGTFKPPVDMQNGYTSVYRFTSLGMHDVTINMPLYSGVDKLLIGLAEDSLLERHGRPYLAGDPIVFYGSSITQGGCASRPGNAYPAMIARKLNMDYLNLGFSGSAVGGKVIAEYLSGLSMRCFVCDYDHNAPSPQRLAETHEPLYRAIRDRQPELPILFVSRPDTDKDPEAAARYRDVILTTYRRAAQAGDRNVYFADGGELFGAEDRDACTVDAVHPNDLGFYRMAEGILKALSAFL